MLSEGQLQAGNTCGPLAPRHCFYTTDVNLYRHDLWLEGHHLQIINELCWEICQFLSYVFLDLGQCQWVRYSFQGELQDAERELEGG